MLNCVFKQKFRLKLRKKEASSPHLYDFIVRINTIIRNFNQLLIKSLKSMETVPIF